MISRPGPASGQWGYCRLRKSQILPFAGDIPGGPRRNGRFAAWILKMRASIRGDLIWEFIFVIRAGRLPRIRAVYGNCGNLRKG